MAQSLSKVYVHAIFSTKYRQNLIDKNIEHRLFSYLGGLCKGLACHPVQVGGYRNHVHILCQLSRTVTQAKLMEDVKKKSSKWIKSQGDAYVNFYWQDGYGIFSVNPYELDVVINYIKNQEAHHQNKSFKKEYRGFLKKYNVEYDERYVWD